MAKSPYTTIDEYIAQYDGEFAKRMQVIRDIVHTTLPTATEKIAWGMPSFQYHGYYVIQFAACKKHIGLYPGAEAVDHFASRLSSYKTTKGSIHLPMDKELDVAFIKEIIVYNSQD